MIKLDWKEIGFDSKTMDRIAYSESSLFVEFKNGSGYKYFNVPLDVYQRILNKEIISASEGKHSYGATLDKLVKKAGYKYEQYK